MHFRPDRRAVLAGLSAFAAGLPEAAAQEGTADLILFNGRITTLDRQNPEAQAIAIRSDRYVAAGPEPRPENRHSCGHALYFGFRPSIQSSSQSL